MPSFATRLAPLVLFLLALPAQAQLSGTYSIDGAQPTAGTNYQTFADATADLESQGVSGPVTFEVASRTYTEQVTLGTVPGASFSRRITFQGIPLLGALPVITYAATSSATDWVARIDARYVTLESLVFELPDRTQALGTVVVVGSPSRGVRITDSEITGVDSGSPATVAPGVLVQSEDSILEGLQITGGTHGVRLLPGFGANEEFDHVVRNVDLIRNLERGIEALAMQNQGGAVALVIEDVYVNGRFNTRDTFVGIDISEMENAATVIRSAFVDVYDFGTGIRLSDISGDTVPTVLETVRVQFSGSGFPLVVEAVDALDVSFSTFKTAGAFRFSRDHLITIDAASSAATLRNLILWHKNGYVLDIEDEVAAAESLIFSSRPNGAGGTSGFRREVYVTWGGVDFLSVTPEELQDAGFLDLASRSVNLSLTGDLHLASSSHGDVYLGGTPDHGLPLDIDGEPRSATYPYVGADEAPVALTSAPLPGLSGLVSVSTLKEAANLLTLLGVDGPTTIEVADGFSDQDAYIGAYRGMLPTRPVQIVAAAGASPSLELLSLFRVQHLSVDGIEVTEVFRVDRLRDVTLSNMSIPEVDFGTYGTDVVLDNVDVAGRIHTFDEPGTYTLFTQRIQVRNSRAQSIFLEGIDMTVENCELVDSPSSRVLEVRGEGSVVRDNIVSGTSTLGGQTGISFSGRALERNRVTVGDGTGISFVGRTLERNHVTVDDGDGISVISATGTESEPMILANNTVVAAGGVGLRVVGRSLGSRYVSILHNSLLTLSETDAALHIDRFGGSVYGNVATNIGNGLALFVEDAVLGLEVQSDVLYTAGSDIARVMDDDADQTFPTLADLQAGTEFESNGVSFLPSFADIDSGDLHLSGPSLGDARLAVTRRPEALTDIDGDDRPAVTYRGADEATSSPLPATQLSVRVWLQGAFDGSAMRTDLRDAGTFPLTQPYAAYNGTPLGYDGTETTTASVLSRQLVVDWVLIELRATPSAAPAERRAALLLADGSVVGPNGKAIYTGLTGAHYVVVRHRNHLSAMTDVAEGLGVASLQDKLYGSGGVSLGRGVWALWAADGSADGLVTAPDFNVYSSASATGATGYELADYTLDGLVTAPDFNLYNANAAAGAATAVPEN